LAIESDEPVAQIAREIGVNENNLYTWISKYNRPIDIPHTVTFADFGKS
jgi:transposase